MLAAGRIGGDLGVGEVRRHRPVRDPDPEVCARGERGQLAAADRVDSALEIFPFLGRIILQWTAKNIQRRLDGIVGERVKSHSLDDPAFEFRSDTLPLTKLVQNAIERKMPHARLDLLH